MTDDDRTARGDTGTRRRELLARAALLALCLLLSVEALAGVARWRTNRIRLNKVLSQSESPDRDDARRRVMFERTPHHAKLIVARTLVYEILASKSGGTELATEAAARLPVARELALEVLRQQANSWQAWMFLGAATYLDWSLSSDRRLYTEAAEWEEPLLKATLEAPAQPEPRRFLAAAYLETWTALSAPRKTAVLELVEKMFREDPNSFAHLGPVWLEVAADQPRALEVIPNLPGPWSALERSFADQRDWQSFSFARRRYLEALKLQLARDLDEAEERLRLGDLATGRRICLRTVVRAPRDGLFADLVTRALDLYPPGLHGFRSRDALKEWLRWALDLHLIGIDPFSPRVISRLTDAVGEIDAATGALAALVAGDAYHLQRYEKLADSLKRPEWASFLIAKSRWLVDRDELIAAERVLKDVHRSAHGSAPYWSARQRLARATGELSDLASADERLAELKSAAWRTSDWRWRGKRATLKLYPEIRASGLEIMINKTPAGGAVAEIVWDGTSVVLEPVAAGGTLELEVEIEPTPHLLELRSLAGGGIYPGAVRLVR